jgi:hypothetical protein
MRCPAEAFPAFESFPGIWGLSFNLFTDDNEIVYSKDIIGFIGTMHFLYDNLPCIAS